MQEFLPTVQKIVATSILEKDGKILLLRGSQVEDGIYEMMECCYFDVPRFEVSFGENPEEVIREQFMEYFQQELSNIQVVDIQHYVIDDNSVQVFEIIYKINCKNSPQYEEALGKFLFADIDDLNLYMLENQLKNIRTYLV